ncbi:hypothetical protein [Fluviispira multicolorata]|uniref:Uncharacterized protein n=1 Tax=Fluviispira multicolorata TaxID=2654512 RepID=A0A833JEU2_9BACT|nr:hypothetical protein [Fluviispira multicolorata]KAB8030644.1 hypothetical protein GCL57_06625 [Fluviispira multicolorata]
MSNELLHEGLCFLQTNRAFLGREFLTWLWFKSETQNHKIAIKQFESFHLYIDDRIVLSSSSGSVRENSLKGGTPAYAYEAGSALGSGKLVHEAKFILQDSERQWSFSILGEDLSLRTIRLPSVSEADSKAHISQRILYTQVLTDLIDELYKEYMKLRVSKNFSEELSNIRLWIDNKVSI